jgi:hypothetical protein
LERISCGKVPAVQANIFTGYIVQIPETFQPAEFGIVMADNSRVGEGTLTEIQVTVRSDDRSIGVVVAPCRRIIDQNSLGAVMRDPQNPSSLQFAAFGDIKESLIKRDAGPWPILLSGSISVIRPSDSRRSRRGTAQTSPYE